jgi:hypothetical protein
MTLHMHVRAHVCTHTKYTYKIVKCPSIPPFLSNGRLEKNGYHKNIPPGETAPGKFLILLLNAWF